MSEPEQDGKAARGDALAAYSHRRGGRLAILTAFPVLSLLLVRLLD